MSIECLNKAIKINGLTPTKKLILVLLANYADEKHTCYPSYSHIAKLTGLKSTKGIKNTIKEFETLGYLRIENRKAEHGGFISNRYHLTLSSITDKVTDNPRVSTDTRVGLPETPNTKENTKVNYSNEFETFWKLYPRKVGKFSTGKAFTKALRHIFYDDLIKTLKIFINENERTEMQFIPHATTWLNQKRFLDYKDKKLKKINLNKLAG